MSARRRAAAIAVVLGLAWPLLAAERTPVVLELRVEAARRVPDRRLDDLARTLRVRLARNECGLVIREPSARDAGPGSPADLFAVLRVENWRETREPGGRPVFDPSTGGDRPGWEVLTEIDARLTIRRPGRERPLYDRERRASARVGTMPIQTFDPAVESRRRAVEWLLRDVERRLCRAARSARRAVR